MGESIIVIGGGAIGSETALHLAWKGRKVTIVEMLDQVANDMYALNRMHLLRLLADSNVRIRTGAEVLEITDKGAVITEKNEAKSLLEADTVVLAVGQKPNEVLLESLKEKVPEIYAIGDCVEPRKLLNAIWEGFRTARLI